MGEFSLTHILLLALIILIFFGPSRLPGLGKSIGQAIKGFKQGLTEIDAESKPVNDQHQQLPTQSQNTQSQQTTPQNQKDKQNT